MNTGVLTRKEGAISTTYGLTHFAFGYDSLWKIASNGMHWKNARSQLVNMTAVVKAIAA